MNDFYFALKSRYLKLEQAIQKVEERSSVS